MARLSVGPLATGSGAVAVSVERWFKTASGSRASIAAPAPVADWALRAVSSLRAVLSLKAVSSLKAAAASVNRAEISDRCVSTNPVSSVLLLNSGWLSRSLIKARFVSKPSI